MKKTNSWHFLSKALATFITLALVLSTFICAVPTAFAQTSPDIWDGTCAESYADGNGTEAEPYLISNGAQLYKMVSENSGYTSSNYSSASHTTVYFKLTNDIYLNDVVSNNIEDIANPNKWYTSSGTPYGFVDSFDGNGFTIYGLYVVGNNRGGLFHQITNAQISNLKLSKSYISDTNGRTGAIAGAVWSGANTTISNCYIDETVKIVSKNSASGIVGYSNAALTVNDTAVLAKITAPAAATAAFSPADANKAAVKITLNGCFSNIALRKGGASSVYSATGSYYLADNYALLGLAARASMPALDWENTWEITGGYPKLRDEAGEPTENKYWDGKAAAAYDSGTGTQADPFIIANAAQLYKMVSENGTNNGNEYYFELKNDIYINDVSDPDWISNSPTNWYSGTASYYFNDHIDGKGHKVYGLYFTTASAARGGLFPQLSDGATVENLHIRNSAILCTNGRTGAIAGNIYSAGNKERVTIKNCSVENTAVRGKDSSGGFLGLFLSASVDIIDSYFIGGVSSVSSGVYGGIVADGWGGNAKLKNCYSAGAYVICGDTAHAGNYTYENVYTSTATAPKTGEAVSGITALAIDKMLGNSAKTHLNGFNWNTVWSVGEENELPELYSPDFAEEYWDGTVAENYSSGTGTENDPYIITTAAEMALLASSGQAETTGKYYELKNDISIARIHTDWENDNAVMWVRSDEIGFNSYDASFCGSFNGNGYTVSGIYYELKTSASRAFGLFPLVGANAVIKNVNIDGVYALVSSTTTENLDNYHNYTGAVAGYASVIAADSATPRLWPQISGCAVKNADINSAYAGGIVGGTTGGVKISACSFEGKAEGYTLSSAETDILGGGIIGNNASTCVVADCYTTESSISGNADNISASGNAAGTTEGLNEKVWSITDNGAELNDINIINLNGNVNAEALIYIRRALIGYDFYVIDIDANAGLNILDLVHAKKSFFEPAADAYTLTWSDEFNGDTLDSNVWTQDARMGTGGDLKTNWNNADVENGNFKMLSTYDGEIYSVPNTYTTLNNMSFRYGKLEVRAKLPFGAGAFPSLWLATKDALGGDEKPIYTAEVDMFEVFGQNGSTDSVFANAHKHYKTATVDGVTSAVDMHIQYKNKVSEPLSTVVSDTDAYHNFVFEWTPEYITVSVDGVAYLELDLTKNFDSIEYASQYGATDMSQFHKPMSIMINNHMFTPENSQEKYTYNGSEEIITPMEYDIDYIRLYQKSEYNSLIYTK